MYDFLIKNGKIIDGVNNYYNNVDLAIKNCEITEIANRGALDDYKAKRVLDSEGLVVTPGFIDIHSHDDFSFWYDPHIEGKLKQGITTLMLGNCGTSAAPIPTSDTKALKDFRLSKQARTRGEYPWSAKNIGEYLQELKDLKPAINAVTAVGHNAVRITVMGYKESSPSQQELKKMKNLVRESMRQGAVGLSTGLIYPPGSYADKNELIELAKTASEEGGVYFTHLRSESHSMEKAINEAISIGMSAEIPVQINHFKCLGKSSWGKSKNRLALLKEARNKGLKITCDQYPYDANATSLLNLLPPEAQNEGIDKLVENLKDNDFRIKMRNSITEETLEWENFLHEAGGWEGVMISQAPGMEKFEGELVSDIIETTVRDPFEQVFDIIIETRGSATMILFTMNEVDIEEILKFTGTCIGSDGMPGPGKVHPRFYGTFPRVFRKYVKEKNVIDIFEAVKKMTSQPASIIGLSDRGVIEENMRADLVMFDFDLIEDKASYNNPKRYPEGIPYVMIGGELVIDNGELTDALPGKIGL